MSYFDLHCHPGLKTLFLPQDGSQFSAWHTIGAPNLFGDILSSQSSLQQLSVNREVPLICITLHPPESGMLDQFVIIAGAATIFREYMDPARLKDMYTGTDGYQKVFAEELLNLTSDPRPDDNIPPDIQIKFLKSWADFDPAVKGTVHVVFNIEGGHALYPQGVQGNQFPDPQQALDNLQAFLNKGYLTLYLTPTHLTPNAFITHAYGNKILTKGPLLPRGMGITSDGKALIDFVYSKGMLIDVKHMSLVSRLQFYHIHDKYYPDKPIIASHAGLTGRYAFGEPGDLFLGWSTTQQPNGDIVQVNGSNPKGLIAGTSFYPLSINLFDQDVIAILKSDGLIGLSMDIRILGGKDINGAVVSDYLSTAEFDILRLPENESMAKINVLADALWTGTTVSVPPPAVVADQPEFTLAISAETQEIFSTGTPASTGPNARAHARLLANHLLQIRFIADIAGLPPPWNNICIGSDFDGLIEAVDCCKNITAISNMAILLEQELTAGAAELKVNLGLEPGQIVEQVCYSNAYNFLNKHFGG